MQSRNDSTEAEIRAAYEDGRYLTAYRVARQSDFLEVSRTTSPSHAALAARVLAQAGASRLGRKILLESWRRHRIDGELSVHCAFQMGDSGPLATLDFLDGLGADVVRGWDLEDQSAWLTVRALALGRLRDFAGADRAWSEARERRVDAWIWTARAVIDDERDRPAAALAAIAEARAIRPWYRPTVDVEARVLCGLRRFDDARALLTDAAGRFEASSVLFALSVRQREDGDHDAALRSLEGVVACSPAMELGLHEVCVAMIANQHHLRGDLARSVAVSRLAFDAERGEHAARAAAAAGARVEVAVPQVPQHHNTCAPATLSALAEFWHEAADHLEIAEEICHDGTPAVSERRWCIDRGFAVRELTVTWDAAVALLDAGLPFALTTEFTTSAHAQAVVGYDARRRTLLIRDPSAHALVEVEWEPLAVSQAASGPRGLVFVPAAKAATLDAIELPDAAYFDLRFAVENALRSHDRAAAVTSYEQLIAVAPEHPIRYLARRSLACYDGDDDGVLEWVEAMLAKHPDDPRLQMVKLSTTHGLAGRATRVAIAEQLLRDRPDDPAVLARCASFFAEDGDGDPRAATLARRAVGIAPFAPAYRVLADRLWDLDRRRATRLYRIASCLAEGDEGFAWSYFLAARIIGEVEPALEHLRKRLEVMAGRSAAPARTLRAAFGAIGRDHEAVGLLERALDRHPDDGELLLALVEEHRLGAAVDAATLLLERARGKCHENAWRRSAATLAAQRGQRDEALELWRQIAESSPLDIEARAIYVQHLEGSGQGDVARQHLRALAERFPHHVAIARMLHEQVAPHDPVEARRVLETVLERHPTSGWALHELASACVHGGDFARARDLTRQARAVGHDAAAVLHLEATLATKEGRRDEARAGHRAAIVADADAAEAINALFDLALDAGEARADLEHVARELERQGTRGPGAVAYAEGAISWLDPQAALQQVRAMRERRGHLWQLWTAEIRALLRFDRLDEALAVAQDAARAFERTPGAWYDLAQVHARRDDRAAQITALERALELAPAWVEATRMLAAAVAKAGDLPRARALLDRAITAEPLNGVNRGFLAEVAWSVGDGALAVAELRRAVELLPEYEWAWIELGVWSRDPAVEVEVARDVLRLTPTAIQPRLVLAVTPGDLATDARVALLREVIARNPDHLEAHDLAAQLLAQDGRWDEALSFCRPAFWGNSPPVPLRGRAAWIQYRRGDLHGAIEHMLWAIAAAPSFEWGINQLLAWVRPLGSYVMIAQRVVAAAPSSALAHAHLGEARRELAQLPMAEAAFARALQLDGGCLLARLGMFDVLYLRGDKEAAGHQLARLSDDNPWVVARRVQLAAATGRTEDADAAMIRLLRLDDTGGEPVGEAVAGYGRAGLHPHVVALLDREVAAPEATAAIGDAWWTHVASRRSSRWAWRKIRALPESPASGASGMTHIEGYAKDQRLVQFLWFFVWNAKHLRARTQFWGSVGFCLIRFGFRRVARRWMRDFARRADAGPWMLLNLARAQLGLGAVREAWATCRAALRLPADSTTSKHRMLLATADALEGTTIVARARPDSPEDGFLGRLACIVQVYRSAPPSSERADDFMIAIRNLLYDLRGSMANPVCQRVYRHVIRELSREVDGLGWRRRLILEYRALGW